MNAILMAVERASLFGLIALLIAYGAQLLLDGKVPAAWRVWIWRIAILQMALAALPFSSIDLPVLPAQTAPVAAVSKPQTGDTLIKTRQVPPPVTSKLAETKIQPSTNSKKSLDAVAPSQRVDVTATVADNMTVQPVTDTPTKTLPALSFIIGLLLPILYACGLLWQLLLLGGGAIRIRRMLGECAPLENSQIEAHVRVLATRFSIRRQPRLMCIESGAPLLVGILRPTIVLPKTLLSAPESQLEPVLAHELAHLKRLDLWWSPLLWLIQALFWFHPLSWVGRHHLALEIESACDEAVLRQTHIVPRSYGASLLQNASKLEPTPLVAGVSDGFSSIYKRISRLEHPVKTPKSLTRFAFLFVLAATFLMLIPFRLVARAQAQVTAVPPVPMHRISGIVSDQTGQPVANATIYALKTMRNGEEPIETVKSDSKGSFQFSSKPRPGQVELFADAGTRGMGRIGTSNKPSHTLEVTPSVLARLRFIDPQKRPVAGLKVRLWRVGPSIDGWMALPKATLNKMKATTNAQGIAIMPPLPDGMVAQFLLGDQISKKSRLGMGDIRGSRFAPLSTEDVVPLIAPQTTQTIQLQNVANIRGKITLPDGKNAGNILVLARRINAAEEKGGKGNEMDRNIAQTRSNAGGQYILDGLRPGKYHLWIYPERPLTRDWVGPSTVKTITTTNEVQNFDLIRGAIIDGTVISQRTKLPVQGQTMGLLDSQGSYQYAITDAKGYFRLRTMGGNQHLWIHANGTNSPPAGYILPNESKFDFTLANNETRTFKFELPGEPFLQPKKGTVFGPDGNTVANATVLFRLAGSRKSSLLQRTKTDENGRFSIPGKWSAQPLQLMAESGDLMTMRSTIAVGQGEIRLQLEKNVWANFTGTVLDENKQPVADASVIFHSREGSFSPRVRDVKTDKNGNFRFPRLRPGTGAGITVDKSGFANGFAEVNFLNNGQTYHREIVLRSARKTVSGIVLNQNGTPARGFPVQVPGASQRITTKADGRFFFPQVIAGPIQIYIGTFGDDNMEFFSAKGGDQNLILRRGKGQQRKIPKYDESELPSTMTGKLAPEIRAIKWSNGTPRSLASLRGKVVVLTLGSFNIIPSYEFADFARSYAGKAEFIGIQFNFRRAQDWYYKVDLDKSAAELGFPIALDTLSTNAADLYSQTFSLYKKARYVVIGKDGKILYAGDELDRVITFTADASQ